MRDARMYIAPAIAAVRAMYRELFTAEFWRLNIGDQIEQQARVLQTAHAGGNPAVHFQIGSWLPGAARKTTDAILREPFTLEQARTTVAREYGYRDGCDALERGTHPPAAAFGTAVNALLAGDIDNLRAMLTATPRLATQSSDFGHRATLLHYLGANGVETWRQVTPLNAVALAQLLLECGAAVNAVALIYGGSTALGLTTTSSHPAAAGVADRLAATLRAAGAV